MRKFGNVLCGNEFRNMSSRRESGAYHLIPFEMEFSFGENKIHFSLNRQVDLMNVAIFVGNFVIDYTETLLSELKFNSILLNWQSGYAVYGLDGFAYARLNLNPT